MTVQINELKRIGVLEKPTSLTPGFFSRIFFVKKSDGGLRPIFDLQELNKFVGTKHFHLISHTKVPDFLQPGDCMVKVDISQAYFHLPIAMSHRPFLRLFYKQVLLQMTSLPFGLSSAPRLFSAVTCWVAETLRKKGMRVLVYLDDYLIVHQDPSKLVSLTTEVVKLLELLGWQVNFKKSILTPMRSLEFLGIKWNTDENVMSLPAKKKTSILTAITKILTTKSCHLRQLQCLLDQLNFACYVILRGRLRCRRLQMFLRRFSGNQVRTKRPVPRGAILDLQWWQGALSLTTPIHTKSVSHFLTTDASDIGWGAVLDKKTMSDSWAPYQRPWQCNKNEMFVVLSVMRLNAKRLRDSHVLLQTDNKTAMAYIRKEGGTHSIGLLSLTFQLQHRQVDKWNITLSAQYLPGRYNAIAGRLSRRRPVPEWHLKPRATSEVFKRWGKPDIDLFASERSAIVPNYITIDSRDSSAMFIDSFSREWNCQLGWIFSPPNLIPRVLSYLNKSRGTFLLVAPDWEKPFWRADLQARALDKPMIVTSLQEVLVDLTTGLPSPQVDRLTLKVWKIGGGEIN
ncbi:unnamed protein product [Parnassius mnemosyne]|uniref:Reverse transcriptase domain-containing protein n=1 Tax=Parnassius mnemosyne TaxID=213953 RepID=A0AAV1L1J1_9NEOP